MGNKLPKPNLPNIPKPNIPRPTLPKFLQKDSGRASAGVENGGAAAEGNKDNNVPKIVENDASAAAENEVISSFI